jgi:hypothetical protein
MIATCSNESFLFSILRVRVLVSLSYKYTYPYDMYMHIKILNLSIVHKSLLEISNSIGNYRNSEFLQKYQKNLSQT